MRRDNVKVLALGRLYGMAASTASKKFGVPAARVNEYISMFNSTFPGIIERRKALEVEESIDGIVLNWFGRPVHVDVPKNAYQNFIASNTADVCGLTYQAVHKHLKEDDERNLVMLLHDAVIVDQAANTQRDDIVEVMRNVISELGQFHVDVKSGKNLLEATQ